MQPDRWRQIEDLFQQALDLEPAARSEFLNQNCAGDDELREEVRSLLQAHQQAGTFITLSAADMIAGDVKSDRPQVVGHYNVISEIGRGGMAEVYLAEDSRLGRKMALKILPDFSGQDPDMVLRFKREAQAASALNHPNILTIYDIGESEGRYYIATEYVEGRTVRDMLASGPLKPAQALDIASQVASALEAAHQAGLVHRDIKPENIMVRQDGLAKVLDFGLAKPYDGSPVSTTTAGTSAQIETGPFTVMGTAPYMSPEQARGLKLDARSDLFSLGVVLYEMLSGTRPFEGDTTSDTMAAILTTEPTAVSLQCPGVPEDVDGLLARALAKDREQRYQTAAEFIADIEPLRTRFATDRDADFTSTLPIKPVSLAQQGVLRRAASAARSKTSLGVIAAAALLAGLSTAFFIYRAVRESRAPIDSLAVLPFEDPGGSPDTEYISQGLTESLINTLSELSTLRVMSYNVVSHLKGKDTEPGAVRQRLDVKSMLVGRITERGNDLTINVELVDTRNGAHIWGKRYDLSLTALQQTQEEISTELANQLLLKLTGKDKQILAKQYKAKPEAYQLYLQGRYALNKRDPDWLKKAIEFFNQAQAIDPEYALPYAGLADSYMLLADYNAVPPTQALPVAQKDAERALDLDNGLAEAHTALGHIMLSLEWDWAGAEEQYVKAIALKPDYVTSHQWYANLLAARGRFDEAIAQARKAVNEDPVLSSANQSLGWQLYLAGRYEEAVAQLQHTIELDPSFVPARVTLGLALLELRRYQEALNELREAARLSDDDPEYLAELARGYALAGELSHAQETLHTVEEMAKVRYVSPFYMAQVYAALGKDETALSLLGKAYDLHCSEVVSINVRPAFTSLRDKPGFIEIVRHIGLETVSH